MDELHAHSCRWHYYLLDYCYVVHATLLVRPEQAPGL